MPIFKLEELNYQELENLNPAQTVFFLIISPLEEHAPHLPLGTDLIIAQYFAQRCAEELTRNRPEWNVVLIQSLPVGANVFKFKGSVRHSLRTVYEVVMGYGKAIAQWGFQNLVIISSHGGGGHIAVLEEAAAKITRKYNIRAISLTGVIAINLLLGKYTEQIQKNLYRRLDEEDLKNLKYDYHAGWWETSMILLIRPELVKEKYKELPPVLIENPLQLRADAALKLGNGLGYFGTPSFADVKLAEASSKVLLNEGMKIIYRFLDGEDVSKETQSVLYKSLLFRVNFRRYFWSVIFLLVLISGFILVKML
jgi:creatinine amidohydrolase